MGMDTKTRVYYESRCGGIVRRATVRKDPDKSGHYLMCRTIIYSNGQIKSYPELSLVFASALIAAAEHCVPDETQISTFIE